MFFCSYAHGKSDAKKVDDRHIIQYYATKMLGSTMA
ncbi:hypothetical protein B0I21_11454 [Sphingobacterium paludis]|uniref:Uncharacterized protein n=1 Tax=Sphingobacterium paludis TaxID=1476465 RepID=A0A4R7CQQ6_9SPHI|nr:hypothetical protein B0I21_11454 [Sphingobacterium paludis]